MPAGLPILLDVSRRPVLIVGGGTVACRKARHALDAGATDVRVVSPTFAERMPAAVRRIEGVYETSHLDGVGFVFACTDSPEVNSRVLIDARSRCVLAQRADAHDELPGDFVSLAAARVGGVTVALNSGMPRLSTLLLEQAVAGLDPTLLAMAETLRAWRPRLHASVTDPRQRADLLRALAGTDAIEAFRAGGEPALRAWVRSQGLVEP